MVIKPWTPEFC